MPSVKSAAGLSLGLQPQITCLNLLKEGTAEHGSGHLALLPVLFPKIHMTLGKSLLFQLLLCPIENQGIGLKFLKFLPSVVLKKTEGRSQHGGSWDPQ